MWLLRSCCHAAYLLVLAAVFFGLCPPGIALAQNSEGDPLNISGDAQKLASEYTQAFVDVQKTLANIAFLKADDEERPRQLAPEVTAKSSDAKSSDDLANAVGVYLRDNLTPTLNALSEEKRNQQKQLNELEENWTKVRARLDQAQIELEQAEANDYAAGRIAAFFSLNNRWFLLSASFAMGVFAFVAWHERRHEYRRSLKGGMGRSLGVSRFLRRVMLVFAVATLLLFAFGGQIFDYLMRVGTSGIHARAKIVQENAAISTHRGEQTAQLNELREAAKKSWAESGKVNAMGPSWGTLRESLLDVNGILVAKQKVADSLKEDLKKLKGENDSGGLEREWQANQDKIAAQHQWTYLIRIGMCLSQMGLSVILAVPLMRGIRRRQLEMANTCPLCLGVGTLKPESTADKATGFVKLICRRELNDLNEECGFSFLSNYQEMPKLCFPTLGHIASGKTFWLAMTYRELNQGQGTVDERVRFQKVKSSQSEEFDRLVDDIINARMGTSATQVVRIPYPLLFNFTDSDRWGKSSALLNIFDYSGEVTQSMSLEDPQRRRMLDADGYLFFLDPTKRSEEQAKALVDFAEDVQIIKKAKVGRSLKVPVALCVSKIDLLTTQPYADPGRDGEVGRFYQELAKFDTGKDISLKAMKRRSELMRELRHTIWPGWEIEKQINQLFGGRYM